MESIRLFKETREADVLIKAPYVFSLQEKTYVPSNKTVTAATISVDGKVTEEGNECAIKVTLEVNADTEHLSKYDFHEYYDNGKVVAIAFRLIDDVDYFYDHVECTEGCDRVSYINWAENPPMTRSEVPEPFMGILLTDEEIEKYNNGDYSFVYGTYSFNCYLKYKEEETFSCYSHTHVTNTTPINFDELEETSVYSLASRKKVEETENGKILGVTTICEPWYDIPQFIGFDNDAYLIVFADIYNVIPCDASKEEILKNVTYMTEGMKLYKIDYNEMEIAPMMEEDLEPRTCFYFLGIKLNTEPITDWDAFKASFDASKYYGEYELELTEKIEAAYYLEYLYINRYVKRIELPCCLTELESERPMGRMLLSPTDNMSIIWNSPISVKTNYFYCQNSTFTIGKCCKLVYGGDLYNNDFSQDSLNNRLTYEGTVAEWNNIKLDLISQGEWNKVDVQCSDGVGFIYVSYDM